MAGIIEVCVGWILGIGSSYVFRIYDRNEKKNNFINGIQAELLELLPRIVSNVYVGKRETGKLNHDVLKWIDSKGIPEYTFVKHLLSYPAEEFSQALAIMRSEKAGQRPILKMFNVDYIERNIDMLPLMDEKIQLVTITITNRLKLVNQEIENYRFYFEKTFDPESCKTNLEIINTNIEGSLNVISRELTKIADKITELLLMIEEIKNIKPSTKLKRLIRNLVNYIKDK